MNDHIVIRPITPADVSAFREIRIEALRVHPTAFTADLPEAEQRPIEAWQERVAESTGEGTGVIMVADADGRLAGVVGVVTPKQPKLAHSGTVWGVYVREAFRHQGIGQRLLDACIAWARGKGLAILKLSSVQGNGDAVRCYERAGFVAYGVEPQAVQWEGRFYDETLMAMKL